MFKTSCVLACALCGGRVGITYTVAAHPEDGQARPKHVDATN
jgi:hypothetical protein